MVGFCSCNWENPRALWNEGDPSFSPYNLQQLFANEKLIIDDVIEKPIVHNDRIHYEL